MKLYRRDLLKAVTAFTVPKAAAQTPAWSPERASAVESFLKQEMTKQGIPGLSVAMVARNKLVWSGGFGFADLEHNVAATSSTLYRIASASKPITSTAAMQLYEKGKLDLDAPVQEYVPGFPRKPWPITSRQLLQHLAGIRHYGPEEEVNTRHFGNVTASLEIFGNDPLLHEPGTNFRYTSYGFVLLGAVIEGASGMSYADYVRANILPAMRNDQHSSGRCRRDHRASCQRIPSGQVRPTAQFRMC